jgi:hypothetical protein
VGCSGSAKGGERIGGRLGGRAYYEVIKSGIVGFGLDASTVGVDLEGGEEGRQRLEDEGISWHKSTDVSPATSARPSCSSSMRRSGCMEGARWRDCFSSFGLMRLPLDSLPCLGVEKIHGVVE